MYEPLYDMVNERQRQMRQEAETNHRLAAMRPANLGLRQRFFYNLGGMLIAFGTRLREKAPEPCVSTAPAAPYRMTEGC